MDMVMSMGMGMVMDMDMDVDVDLDMGLGQIICRRLQRTVRTQVRSLRLSRSWSSFLLVAMAEATKSVRCMERGPMFGCGLVKFEAISETF